MPCNIAVALLGVAALSAACAGAAELPPDVLVKSSRVTITRADFDAEIAAVRPDLRAEFLASKDRLSKLLNGMLEFKTLAAEARASGLDKDPEVQARVAAQIDRTLAAIRGEQIEREASIAFERRREDFLVRARELYLLEKDKYTQPAKVRAMHILLRTDRRSKEEALKLATEVRALAVAPGADFSALAEKYSEDLTVKTNKGDLGWIEAKGLDRAFSRAAFAMKPGDVSEPVLSQSGYHIILLEERKPAELQPFDAVRDQIMVDIRHEYVKAAKTAVLDGIYRDPTMQVNQPALDALAVGIDPAAIRKAGEAATK